MGNRNSLVLDNLQERNNLLQSKLIHDQLKYGTYHFGYFKNCLVIISEYKKFRSFFKVSTVLDISQNEMINWYIKGQMGNSKFRSFYLAINGINNRKIIDAVEDGAGIDEEIVSGNIVNEEKDYAISQYGDGWSYRTFIDGKKIFIISNELRTLKDKVKSEHLPLD
ncbi:hypothetical protein [Methanobrevibacter sp.]|uniref:hypothetical protein n=1 Tax=Methanobrevibacter sp. TaxID=66852 RepID=UPI0025F3565D|nr:hypothetical protein [Methanobrevibacter sp.]MBR4446969.1 hypothetical protein [Methanobrevibacter sp.]